MPTWDGTTTGEMIAIGYQDPWGVRWKFKHKGLGGVYHLTATMIGVEPVQKLTAEITLPNSTDPVEYVTDWKQGIYTGTNIPEERRIDMRKEILSSDEAKVYLSDEDAEVYHIEEAMFPKPSWLPGFIWDILPIFPLEYDMWPPVIPRFIARKMREEGVPEVKLGEKK